MKRALCFHSLLFSIYPIFALYSYNIDQVHFGEIQRSLEISLCCTVTMLLVFQIILRDWKRSSLVVSLILILFYTYGHAYQTLEGKSIFGIWIGRADYLAALWATVLIIGPWWIIRILKKTDDLTRFLNTVAVVALIIPGYHILAYKFKNPNASGIESLYQVEDLVSSTPNKPASTPDIYYIILDGYGRSDVLDEIYNYDNSEFIDFLKKNGFYVAENSHSNYAQTALSLSSSLNYEYINGLSNYLNKDSTNRDPLVKLIRNDKIQTFLKTKGYQFVALASGYSVTELNNADVYLASSEKLNSFESMLISDSAAVLWLNYISPKWYRERILNAFQTLANMPDIQSPKFVFAHILVPHPPFVFGSNGEVITPKSFKEGNYYDGTREEYISGYRGQITYINKLAEEAIQGILLHSDTDPIIIVQGDHGPGSSLNWDVLEQDCLKERMSILNAYHLPGNLEEKLYASITPVNTFRFILNEYFGAKLGLVDDQSYFSRWNNPYGFVDVTGMSNSCSNTITNNY
jgi:hypothetical protein